MRRERAGQVADLVARGGVDRVVEIAGADDGHGLGELADRAGQAPRR